MVRPTRTGLRRDAALTGRETSTDGDRRDHLEPVQRPRLPARPRPVHLALAAASHQRSETTPTSRSTATSSSEFAAVLSAARWDVALLQECPPRWAPRLAAACDATMHRTLTSRNWLASIRGPAGAPEPRPARLLGGRLQPDPGPGAARRSASRDRRELLLRRRPERRKVDFARPGPGALRRQPARQRPRPARRGRHPPRRRGRGRLGRRRPADPGRRPQPAPDATAASTPSSPSGSASSAPPPPRRSTTCWPAASRSSSPPRAWPPEAREVPFDGLAIRLSDHAPVERPLPPRRASR